MNRKTLAAIAAFLVALGTLLGALITPNDTTTRTVVNPAVAVTDHPVTVTLGGPTSDKLVLAPQAQAITAEQAAKDAAGLEGQAESGLHETAQPTGTDLAKARAVAPASSTPIPAHIPAAAQSAPGCKTALVRNYSRRPAGARVLLGFIHWTASRYTLGSAAGGEAIVHWFDNPGAQASSNEITDQDGRCWLVVPEAYKAWTQANANPWAVSVEITNTGTGPLFVTKAARDAVVRLMIGWHHRWGIPYQYGKVNSSCVPTRPGFLKHRDGGPCAGGHPDVGDFDLTGLISEAARVDHAGSCSKTCRNIRARHAKVHRDLARVCAHPAGRKRHPKVCRRLVARERYMHRYARAHKFALPAR